MIEVWDASSAMSPSPKGALYAESGRGLLLVESLASRWGVRAVAGGKCVWFALEAA